MTQNKKVDSLLNELKNANQDTAKILLCSKIAGQYQKNKDYENAFLYTSKGKLLAGDDYLKFHVKILKAEASFLKKQSNFQAAIDTLRKAVKIAEGCNCGKDLANVYMDLGVVYRITGNFKYSIQNILKSVPLAEKYGVSSEIVNAYNSLANSYSALASSSNNNADDFEKAIGYYKKAENFIENDPKLTAMIYTNLGVTNGYIGRIKNDSNVLQLARSYHLKSYEIQKELKDTMAMVDVFGNLGVINFELGNKWNNLKYLRSAENYFQTAIKMGSALGINQYSVKGNLAGNYLAISRVNQSNSDLLKGMRLSEEVLEEAKKAGDNLLQFSMFENLMLAYEFSGDAKMAYYYAKKSISMKDTILNSENNNTIRELSAKFETDKKEQENQILKQQGELNTTQLKQQKIFSYSLIIGVIFLIVFALMIYKNLSLSKKSNAIISRQKQEVENQKVLLEEKQKEILDSINYAKRIQQASLPSEKYIERHLSKD